MAGRRAVVFTDALLILLQALLDPFVALHRGSEHGRAKWGLDTALTVANQPNVWLTRLSGKRQWARGSGAEPRRTAGKGNSAAERIISASAASKTTSGSPMRVDHQWLAILVLLSVPANVLAQGGPPMITDDPDTPGPAYWEINLASIIERSQIERRYQAPTADINYGVGERIQLKFEIPWVTSSRPGQPHQAAPGNSNAGVKWRFLGQEGQRIAWSVYPQLELNTGNAALKKEVVDEGPRFLLPTELTLQIGRLEINSEIGREFGKDGNNGWVGGLLCEFEFSRALEFLAELHADKPGSDPTALILNFGGRPALTSQVVLLLAAGTTVSGPPGEHRSVRAYIGLQINLPQKRLEYID